MRAFTFALCTLAATATACTTVEPQLPPALQSNAATLPIKGANGLHGTLRMSTLDGRSVAAKYGGYGQSVTFFDVAQRKKFKTRFTQRVAGSPDIEADCRADVQNYTLNQPGVTIQTTPMTYGCTFTRKGEVVGVFDLSDLGNDRVVSRSATLKLDGVSLDVASLHKDTTSGMTLAYPIAYSFARNGETVASVNVAGDRGLTLRRGMDSATEEAVRLGAIALSILSDPSA